MTRAAAAAAEYWDACVLLDLILATPARIAAINSRLLAAERGQVTIYTSAVSAAEVIYGAQASGQVDDDAVAAIAALWRPPSPINVLDFNLEVAETAAAIFRDARKAGVAKLKPMDRLHVATACVHGLTTFSTFDGPLAKKIRRIPMLKHLDPGPPGR